MAPRARYIRMCERPICHLFFVPLEEEQNQNRALAFIKLQFIQKFSKSGTPSAGFSPTPCIVGSKRTAVGTQAQSMVTQATTVPA
jgi:hypothetical protein